MIFNKIKDATKKALIKKEQMANKSHENRERKLKQLKEKNKITSNRNKVKAEYKAEKKKAYESSTTGKTLKLIGKYTKKGIKEYKAYQKKKVTPTKKRRKAVKKKVSTGRNIIIKL